MENSRKNHSVCKRFQKRDLKFGLREAYNLAQQQVNPAKKNIRAANLFLHKKAMNRSLRDEEIFCIKRWAGTMLNS